MRKPSLSVIMANYNHSRFLAEALDAILKQSYAPSEIGIIDDASTDNSLEILQEYARENHLIKLYRNEKNMGVIHNANRLLKLASGDYVYFAAADDKILPGFFEKSMSLLSQYPRAGLCCSDPVMFDGCTGAVTENRLCLSDNPCYFTPDEMVKLSRKKNPWIAGHTCIVKRSVLKEAGNYIPSLKWHCDWFTMLVISFRYGICYIPQLMASLRVLQKSYSSTGTKQWSAQRKVLSNMLDILKSPAYRDVLPKFRHSAVLSCFGMGILLVILSNPKHKDFLTPLLLQRILWNETRRILSPVTPPLIKKLYHVARDR